MTLLNEDSENHISNSDCTLCSQHTRMIYETRDDMQGCKEISTNYLSIVISLSFKTPKIAGVGNLWW